MVTRTTAKAQKVWETLFLARTICVDLLEEITSELGEGRRLGQFGELVIPMRGTRGSFLSCLPLWPVPTQPLLGLVGQAPEPRKGPG